jgi:hypothetical protein
MAYPRRDTEGAFLGGNPLPPSEATPQPYSPEHERANPPSPCVPAVSILRCITFILSMPTLFSRPHLPCTAPATTPNGAHPRCTRAFRTSVMACRCHISMVWLADTTFGLTRSRMLRSALRRGRRRRALSFLSSDPRRAKCFFIECCDGIHEREPESRHNQRREWSYDLLSGQ